MELEDQDQKRSRSSKIWLDYILWKTPSLIHYFLVNLVCVFHYFRPSFEKVLFMALYCQKIRVWGSFQTMLDSFQTRIKCKKLSLHNFWNPSCIHMPVHACACHKHVYAWLECVYAYACMRLHTLGFSAAILFQK